MKKLTLGLLGWIALSFIYSFSLNPEDISFADAVFKLSSKDGSVGVVMLKEYMLDGEVPDNFSQKLSILSDATEGDLDKAIKTQLKEFSERKKSEPTFKYNTTEMPDGQSVIFDFITKKPSKSIVDFNVIKIYPNKISDKNIEIIMIHFKMRSYGDDISTFQKYILENKEIYINAMRGLKI